MLNDPEPLCFEQDSVCCHECNKKYVGPARRVLWHIPKEDYAGLKPLIRKIPCEKMRSLLDGANVLLEWHGYQLVERYGRTYCRFWGGREDDMPCEVPVSDEFKEKTIADPCFINHILMEARKEWNWTAQEFYQLGITQFLIHGVGMSSTEAHDLYKGLTEHQKKALYRLALGK